MRSRSLHAVHLVAAASAVVALGVLLNCGDVVPNLENGARCSLNSDCKAPLVCGFERCRAQCKTSRDCGGKLCVRGQDGASVCQLDDEVECTHNSECPGSQLCGPDRHCRDVCITDKDCVTDLLCVSRVCAKPEELVNGTLPQKSPADAGASCTYATDCPGDLVCLYGRCDVECLGDKDCLVGWSCKPTARAGDGRCYPNATASDAGPDATSDASPDATTPPADGGADASDASDGSAPLPPGSVLSVAADSNHTCALLVGNKVKCWGENSEGQLGLGDTVNRGGATGNMGDNLPYVDLGTGRTVKSLDIGTEHTCALLDDGRVKCWGFNVFGALGLGDVEARGDAPGEMGDNLPYVDLGTGRTAKSLGVGYFFNCALLDNGRVKCWGYNFTGELGLGNVEGRGDAAGEMGDNLPYVDLGTGRTAKSIAVAEHHSCAVLDNDRVKCWGANAAGELGLGDPFNRGDEPGEMGDSLPYVDLGTGRTAKSLRVGVGSTCAVLDNDKVKCWGYNAFGGLGLGDALTRGDAPGEMGDSLPYVELGTGRTAKSLGGGGYHACAVLDNDKVKCWGYNALGELGLGDTQNRGDGPAEMGDSLPYVDLGTVRTARSVSDGRGYHTCAVLDTRQLKCWGRNGTGQLGLGDTQNRGGAAGQMGDALPYVKLVGP